MEAMRINRVVQKDGEVLIQGLPCKKGQQLEIILLFQPPQRETLTANKLLNSGLAGLWNDRNDIGDSAEYARKLRDEAQRRK